MDAIEPFSPPEVDEVDAWKRPGRTRSGRNGRLEAFFTLPKWTKWTPGSFFTLPKWTKWTPGSIFPPPEVDEVDKMDASAPSSREHGAAAIIRGRAQARHGLDQSADDIKERCGTPDCLGSGRRRAKRRDSEA